MLLCRTQGSGASEPQAGQAGQGCAESSGQCQLWLLTSPPWASLDPRQFVRVRELQHTRVHTHKDARRHIHADTYTHVASEHSSGGRLYSDGVGVKYSLGQEREPVGPQVRWRVNECSLEEGWCGA